MLKQLKQYYHNEFFHPTWLSILVNPFYFSRKGLDDGVKKYAHYMRGVMLDFGCGHKPYEQYFNVEEYVGLDIAESGHDHLKASRKSKIDVFYDGKVLPFTDAHFDSVFTSQVIEHVFNLDEIFQEINRVLKPQGTILLTLPFVWREHEIPYDFARYTSFGIKYLLEKYGFRLIEQTKSSNDVEAIIQIWNAFLVDSVFPKNPKFLSIVLKLLVIPPFTILGILLSKILPHQQTLYHSNIVVAEKIASC